MRRTGLLFSYDIDGDVPDMSVGHPKKAISNEVEDDVFVRFDPTTSEVVGFSILNFTKRFSKGRRTVAIPIEADFEYFKK